MDDEPSLDFERSGASFEDAEKFSQALMNSIRALEIGCGISTTSGSVSHLGNCRARSAAPESRRREGFVVFRSGQFRLLPIHRMSHP